MSTTIPALPTRIPYPGPALADLIPGGWAKRASVPPARLPRIAGEQYPCPSNGHLELNGSAGWRRGLACTHHQPGQHLAVSLGHVLAVWIDESMGQS